MWDVEAAKILNKDRYLESQIITHLGEQFGDLFKIIFFLKLSILVSIICWIALSSPSLGSNLF